MNVGVVVFTPAHAFSVSHLFNNDNSRARSLLLKHPCLLQHSPHPKLTNKYTLAWPDYIREPFPLCDPWRNMKVYSPGRVVGGARKPRKYSGSWSVPTWRRRAVSTTITLWGREFQEHERKTIIAVGEV